MQATSNDDLNDQWRDEACTCDELRELSRWKSRSVVDRYANSAAKNPLSAAPRIERGGRGRNV